MLAASEKTVNAPLLRRGPLPPNVTLRRSCEGTSCDHVRARNSDRIFKFIILRRCEDNELDDVREPDFALVIDCSGPELVCAGGHVIEIDAGKRFHTGSKEQFIAKEGNLRDRAIQIVRACTQGDLTPGYGPPLSVNCKRHDRREISGQ